MSYSHDSEEHKDWVLKLAYRLRSNGVDVCLDRIIAAVEALLAESVEFSRRSVLAVVVDGQEFVSQHERSKALLGSRDHRPNTAKIEQAAKGLSAAGFTVVVDIDDTARPVEAVEADRAARHQARAEALGAAAARSDRNAQRAWEGRCAVPSAASRSCGGSRGSSPCWPGHGQESGL